MVTGSDLHEAASRNLPSTGVRVWMPWIWNRVFIFHINWINQDGAICLNEMVSFSYFRLICEEYGSQRNQGHVTDMV